MSNPLDHLIPAPPAADIDRFSPEGCQYVRSLVGVMQMLVPHTDDVERLREGAAILCEVVRVCLDHIEQGKVEVTS